MQLNRVNTTADSVQIRNALISTADKTGLESFVTRLWELIPDLTIYSTGGTYALLQELERRTLPPVTETDVTKRPRVRTISSYTGQPEMQGGLVKTLDYRVYLSLLSEQFNRDHQADLARTAAIPFDLTVCSLYPFEEIARDPQATLEDLRTHIDIGGPAMLRASAKNFLRVLVVCDPAEYGPTLETIERNLGSTPLCFRLAMAQKAFQYTARYEAAIAAHIARVAEDTDLESLYDVSAPEHPEHEEGNR